MITTTAQKARADRLGKLAQEAVQQYNDDLAKGSEPIFPDWVLDLAALIADYDRLVAAMAKQRLHPVNAVDFETGKCSASIIQQVPK